MNRIDTAITNREIVKIGARAGHAQGLKGIALGYNAQYDTVKVGFVNESGEYTGEYTKVGAAHIEFVTETEAVQPSEVKTPEVSAPSNHWGCSANEERSPFHTGRKTCAGEVTANRTPDGIVWLCERHWAQHTGFGE